MERIPRYLVIGASGGIGRAVCAEIRARGWECVGTSRCEGAAEWTLDLADRDGLELSFMRLFAEKGPFDGLVYCAGVCPVVPLSRIDSAALSNVQAVNCDAFVLLMKHFSRPGAYAKEGATAVAVSSISATEGWAGGALYCASKGALSAVCRALAVELSPKKIKVVSVEPRHVLTDMFRSAAGRMGVPESAARLPEDFARDVVNLFSPCLNREDLA